MNNQVRWLRKSKTQKVCCMRKLLKLFKKVEKFHSTWNVTWKMYLSTSPPPPFQIWNLVPKVFLIFNLPFCQGWNSLKLLTHHLHLCGKRKYILLPWTEFYELSYRHIKIKKSLSPFYHKKYFCKTPIGCVAFTSYHKHFLMIKCTQGFFILMWRYRASMYHKVLAKTYYEKNWKVFLLEHLLTSYQICGVVIIFSTWLTFS